MATVRSWQKMIFIAVMFVYSIAGSGVSYVHAEAGSGSAPVAQLQELMQLLQRLQLQLQNLPKAEPVEMTAATTISSSDAYDIIVVAGQSNSVGFGKGSYTEDQFYNTAANRGKVFQLGRCLGRDMQIAPVTQEPLDFWAKPDMCTIQANAMRGAGYPLALRLAANTAGNRKVLIIPAAKGGTSILLWDKVVEFPNDNTELYDDMIKRVNHVLNLNSENRVVAVMWRQGEADVSALYNKDNPFNKFLSAQKYQDKMNGLRYNIRHDLVRSQGCIPMLYGDMTEQWVPVAVTNQAMTGAVAKKTITDIIKNTAAADFCEGKSAFVSAAGTTANAGDVIHFDASGQFEMAKRYFEAYKKFVPSAKAGCATSTDLMVGSKYTTKDSFQIRKGAGLSYGLFATPLATGTVGTLIAGPVSADNLNWFNVSYSNGMTGWSRAIVLKDHAASITNPEVCPR